MNKALTTASTLICPHQAPVMLHPDQRSLLRIEDGGWLSQAALLAGTIPDCPDLQAKCVSVATVEGVAARLRVADSKTLLLDDVEAKTNAGSITVQTVQSVLRVG